MAKLYFRYGAMNSGKSIDILKVAHNYEERGQKILLLTSALDDRYGVGKIKSRIGIEKDAIIINTDTNILDIIIKQLKTEDIKCVLVDEVQFFNKKQIFQLSDIVDYYNIPVICYGLRSDFMLDPFEGSKYLMTIADSIEEIKTICHCGKKASINTKVINDKVVTEGKQVEIGGNELYVSLCRKCYKEGKIK